MSTKPPKEIEKVIKGDKHSCFSFISSGINSGWINQADPKEIDILPFNIPNMISQYWHSENLPEEISISSLNMRNFNKEYSYHIENDNSAREFILTHYGKEICELFDACFHPAMRSDFWRLCWLYEKGGIYVDIDTKAHGPIGRIAAGSNFSCFLTYSIGKPWCIDNDFIITEPRNSLISFIMNEMFNNIRKYLKTGNFENIWVETGPGVTTIATARYISNNWLKKHETPKDSGLIFRHHNAVAEAFYHHEMEYKKTPDGNWRLIRAPRK